MSNLYGATALTGGGTKALDGSTYYDGDDLVDGDGAIVITSSSVYAFHLDAASGAAENSPLVISPDANAGTKRWLLKSGVFAGLTLYGNIVMPDGGTIGQSAGPLLKFNDSANKLGITGCDVGFGTDNPSYSIDVQGAVAKLRVGGAGDHIIGMTGYGGDGSHQTFSIRNDGISYVAINTQNSIPLSLGVSSTTGFGSVTRQMTILVSGNVGFNETNPQAKFHLAGDMLFSGASSGLPFGEINVIGNVTETAIATQNVYVQITTFNANGESLNVTPDHTNDHLTITKAGRYFISCSITLNSVGGSGSTAEMEVKKNNGTSRVGSLHVDRSLSGGGTESGAITLTGIANLSVSDTIEVWIKNETNTQNYVVEDITLTISQKGG